jgi:hypothetical protein
MDVIRSARQQLVYWDAAKTLSSMVKWYFVPDDRPFFHGENRFTCEIWDPVHWYAGGAGFDELSPPLPYNGKAPGPYPGLPGKFCGKKSWFADGCPSDAPPLPRRPDGLPACCFGRGAYSSAFSDAWDTFSGS